MPTKPPQHVKLERLIPIAAQLAVALHLGSDDIEPDDHAIRHEIKSQAYALRSHNGDLISAFGLLRRKITNSLDGSSPSDEFTRAVDALKAGLGHRECKHCHPEGEPPCRRDLPTNERVDTGGNCIGPIKNLYKDIEQEIFRLWKDIFADARQPGLRMATSHVELIDKPAVHKDFSLTGKAVIVDNPRPVTTIVLGFYESAFDWEQFTLLPYLLFHEIVCHGLQDVYDVNGCDVARTSRHSAAPTCLWSEGWMDTVAHHLATDWLRRCGASHRIDGPRIRRAERWIGQYHDARYGEGGQVLSPERHLGRKAFERIKTNITAVDFSEASALNLLTRFSLLLNACVIPNRSATEMPNDRRSQIVKDLDVLAVGPEPERARQVMEKFVASRNFDGLVA